MEKQFWVKGFIPLVSLVLAIAPAAMAGLSLPAVISENAVLQRDLPLPIWGKAEPGQTVSVEFAGQKKTAQADGNGKWRVTLDPLPANAQGREMQVQAGGQMLRVGNLLVGDVWLGSGQSNMQFSLAQLYQQRKMESDIATATNPMVRLFVCKTTNRLQGEVDTDGWKVSSPSNVMESSAVAYYFAQEVVRDQKLPVGVITSAWGGTRIELWTPSETCKSSAAYTEAEVRGSLVTIDGLIVGMTYDRMIRPLVPYALRGVLWYQGESNILGGDKPARFMEKTELLMACWRTAWGREDLPFYFVQLAPYRYSQAHSPVQKAPISPDILPAYQDVQRRLLSVPHTGMAVITDLVANTGDVHPINKSDVGKRLWLLAAADCYGKKGIESSGPLFKTLQIRDGKAKVTFDHTGGGLVANKGEPLRYFEICGEDGQYRPAHAEIKGDDVVVSEPTVTRPVAVRYGWDEAISSPSLYNNEGLPASPFCSKSAAAAGTTCATR